MEELISVIVPIYNVEKYIRKCVDSILKQTYKNIEVILVDDGSKDECGKIIDEYKKIDGRIKVIHKKNGGLSDARNCGMQYATGKFLLFIDSDDWIDREMVKKLYDNIKKYNADISICEFIEEDEEGKELSKKKYDEKILLFTSKEAIKELIVQKNITNHAWNKLYKKEIFDNIEYPKGQLMEDVSTTYKLIENSKQIVYQNIALYHYIQRNKSILGNITPKRINDQEKAFFERNKYLEKKYPEYLTALAVPGYAKTNGGENKNPQYDSAGNMIHATWEGTSWMWYPGNDVTLKDTSSYPQTTLGGTKVPSTDEFSIVLSYDTTRFDW